MKLIEAVFNVAPLAVREESNDVGNLLTALNLHNSHPAVPSLPHPGYVIPSSLCFSSIDAADLPAAVISELARRPPSAIFRDDEEPTIFLQMINKGMVKGFPGH